MAWVYNLATPDPNSHVARVIAICLTFSIIALLAVVLRLYIRIYVKRSVWVDDYACLFSAVLSMAYACIAVAQTRWGLGLDSSYFPDQNVVPYSKIQYAGGPVYTLALLGFKVSLLSSYLRVGGFVKVYRVTGIIVIVACACNQLVFTLLLLFACRPIAKQWDTSISGTCIDTVASYYALAGTSLGFDVIIIGLPLPVLLKLQLRLRQKVALIGVFALGFFVTIIQIIRIFTIKNLKTYTDSQPIVIWSDIEISLGVIIACIPTYGPLFKSFASNISSYRNRQAYLSYPLASGRQHSRTQASSNRRKLGSHASYDDMDRYVFDEGPDGSAAAARPFDNATPHTTTVMSTQKALGDNSSEEHILEQGSGLSLGSNERGFHIQKVMEVKVERHDM
ncbi:hypothetical protein BDV59DRAFT_167334 [Aspergillus ambiguus]|uniref:putative integral membrane protein (Pth11) n=1 Tax=Aspergillus ambiguus TaxID=176160 RepID=UPI003CCD2AB6